MSVITLRTSRNAVHSPTFVPWLDDVTRRSGGRVRFVFEGDEVIDTNSDQLRLLREGIVDVRPFYPSYFPEEFPLSAVANLPFFYPSAEVAGAVCWELLNRYMVDEYREFAPLWLFVPGIFDLFSTSAPVRELDDLRRAKFSMAGFLPTEILRALGGYPVLGDSYSEMNSLMERGLLDGVASNWGQPVYAREWIKGVAKSATTNLRLYTAIIPVVMRRQVWDSLPPDIQTIFEQESGLERTVAAGAFMDREDRTALAEARADPPFELVELSAEERQKWVRAVEPVTQQWVAAIEAKGLPGAALVADAANLVRQYTASLTR